MTYITTQNGIFYENTISGQTAEEVYQEWLSKKDEQIDICPEKTTEEKLADAEEKIQQLQADLDEQTNINLEQDETIISLLESAGV